MRYFRDQGAKFAGILATVPSAANVTKRENSYLFEKDVIFSEDDLTGMNRDFEMHLTTGKILRIVGVIVLGLLSGNYSLASLKALLRSVRMSGGSGIITRASLRTDLISPRGRTPPRISGVRPTPR